jgi:phosphatidate cytidylyltransferase
MNLELKKRIYSSFILLPLTLLFILEGSFLFTILIIFFYVIALIEWSNLAKKNIQKFLGYSFLTVSFFTAYRLRMLDQNEIPLNFLFVISISVFTDLGGFFFGKIFKGPKLTKISPNKTISGFIGSYLLSLLIMYYIFLILNIDFTKMIFLTILILSTISQSGDLIISYFKRLSNVKDTGKLIPGHGGLLDRIDGMLFSIPFFYLIILLF